MECLYQTNVISYARMKLPALVPNVNTLMVASSSKIVNTPMVPGKFLHLKYLCVSFIGLAFFYDYLSLVSFFDASPSLETLMLSVSHGSYCKYGSTAYPVFLFFICCR